MPPERMRGLAMRGSSLSCRREKALILRAVVLALTGAILMPLLEESCFASSSPQLLVQQLQRQQVDKVAGRVKVYVYDDPVFDNTALIQCYRDQYKGVAPWQDERADMAQDMGEVWLHQSFLTHPWRVLDPESADLFFIPLLPVLGFKLLGDQRTCDGLTHQQRLTRSIMHLVKKSTHFNRFGGADHIVVCAWWNCRRALSPQHRMLLRRTAVGINEKLDNWAMWGCREKMVTVPYTASSVLTTTEAIGGRRAEERDIPFTFVGTTRGRPERKNLKVVEDLSPDSVVALGTHGYAWSEGASEFAEDMSRSRFCFCPRGDSISSRRIFDAIAAGCIPVLTTVEAKALPFLRTGLNYSELAIVVDKGSFDTTDRLGAIVKDLSSRSDEQLASLREGLGRGRSSILYGTTEGPTLADMKPFYDTASRFLQEVQTNLDVRGLWNCPSSHVGDEMLSPRTLTKFPPDHKRQQWLRESETIVNIEHSLLFCAPPNTGSLQFRMLAKRMEGVDHWTASNDRSLLFDPVASDLTLLDLDNARLMEDIYTNNGSGWIKIGVVRDPVTRLLSAYFDLVRASPSLFMGWSSNDDNPRQRHRGLRVGGDWEWFDVIRRRRSTKEDENEGELPEAGDNRRLRTVGGGDEGARPMTRGDEPRALEDATEATGFVPTFEEVLDLLAADIWAAPSAFRPAASLCGMWQSPFDTIIPFETLQDTSTKVLKSLPGDIWRSFGESGWGPQGKHAFMEFDYGSAARHDVYADQQEADRVPNEGVKRVQNYGRDGQVGDDQNTSLTTIARRARDLFANGSCAWTEYYADQTILDQVGHIYSADFDLFEWYNLDSWRQRLEACLKGRE